MRTDVLGIPVDCLQKQEVLQTLEGWLISPESRQVVTLNSLMVLQARELPELLRVIEEAALVVADSSGILWACRVLGRAAPEHIPGIDLMVDLCRTCAQKGLKVYLIGGEDGVARGAAANLKKLCPGLRVAGFHHGYFGTMNEQALFSEIRRASPNVLFAGLGMPRQELWIHRHLITLGVPVAMGIGGSLDVLAGRVRRAPPIFRRLGIEWSYRLAQEPRRLPRILKLFHFAAAVIRQKLLARCR